MVCSECKLWQNQYDDLLKDNVALKREFNNLSNLVNSLSIALEPFAEHENWVHTPSYGIFLPIHSMSRVIEARKALSLEPE